MALLSVQNVSKTFKDHDYRVHAVRNASLEVHRGEMIAIIDTQPILRIHRAGLRPDRGGYLHAEYSCSNALQQA